MSVNYYRVIADFGNPLTESRLRELPVQQSICVRCLYLCQIAYGEGGWIPKDVALEFVNNHFKTFGGVTRQEPWRIFRFYEASNVDEKFLEVRQCTSSELSC